MKRHIQILILSTPLALQGCGSLNCTEMGCAGMLALTIDGAELIDGSSYALSVDMGEEGTELCEWTWSDESGADTDCARVDEDGQVLLDLVLGMGVAPESITVTLEEDGEALISSEVEPEWSEPYYPNGEECDADYGCSSASIAFGIDQAN